jgi:hypothetical protein
MTIANDPKPFTPPPGVNRYDSPGIREITDEVIFQEEPDVPPDPPYSAREDWNRMYTGERMEENY